MKIGIIGSGLGGLVSGAYLAKNGHEVHLFEQYNRIGGVLAPYKKDGYKWDLGQLLIEGMEPGQPMGDVLDELGVFAKIQVKKDDRRYVFPDMAIDKPEEYEGLKWRIEELKKIFPEEKKGLDKYYKYYKTIVELIYIGYRLGKAKGLKKLGLYIVLYSKLLPLAPKQNWSAEKFMNYLFKSKKLQCVFISILADFFTEPSKFMGLGVFGLNPEPSFDARMSSSISKWGKQLYFYSILNGISTMADALGEVIEKNGGNIHLNTLIDSITLKDGVATGLVYGGNSQNFDMIIANGGARETFDDLVGEQHLPETLKKHLDDLPLMHGVFMVHLGLDFDPSVYTKSVCTYYYGTYDFEEGIGNAKSGFYHEGEEGFVVHVPTLHTPSMAPEGNHAMTIYTICPDTLATGTWGEMKEKYATKLIEYAEKFIPNLSAHVLTKEIITPDDFKERLHVKHFAFGGLAPEVGKTGIAFKTPIPHLFYVGAQSETGGGVNRLGIETANNIKKLLKDLQ